MSQNQLATHVHAWTPDPLSAEVKLSLQKLAGEDDVRHLPSCPMYIWHTKFVSARCLLRHK